jgi:tRNA nucleotidyltransferase (CCA-adding enzyme)
LRFSPELAALVGVPQDPRWHPEGSVWIHTLRVVDVAAASRTGDADQDELLLWGALCHDLGKPGTTRLESGRVRSPRHDAAGVAETERFLSRLRAPERIVRGTVALVRHHLAPALYVEGGARPRAYRRLARHLERAGVSIELLERVARADHLGRTTRDARAGRFPAGDVFLARARALEVEAAAPRDRVRGRDLLARGVRPGPGMGLLLRRCRAVQDETGWTDAERILERALAETEDQGRKRARSAGGGSGQASSLPKVR